MVKKIFCCFFACFVFVLSFSFAFALETYDINYGTRATAVVDIPKSLIAGRDYVMKETASVKGYYYCWVAPTDSHYLKFKKITQTATSYTLVSTSQSNYAWSVGYFYDGRLANPKWSTVEGTISPLIVTESDYIKMQTGGTTSDSYVIFTGQAKTFHEWNDENLGIKILFERRWAFYKNLGWDNVPRPANAFYERGALGNHLLETNPFKQQGVNLIAPEFKIIMPYDNTGFEWFTLHLNGSFISKIYTGFTPDDIISGVPSYEQLTDAQVALIPTDKKEFMYYFDESINIAQRPTQYHYTIVPQKHIGWIELAIKVEGYVPWDIVYPITVHCFDGSSNKYGMTFYVNNFKDFVDSDLNGKDDRTNQEKFDLFTPALDKVKGDLDFGNFVQNSVSMISNIVPSLTSFLPGAVIGVIVLGFGLLVIMRILGR